MNAKSIIKLVIAIVFGLFVGLVYGVYTIIVALFFPQYEEMLRKYGKEFINYKPAFTPYFKKPFSSILLMSLLITDSCEPTYLPVNIERTNHFCT